MWGGKEGVLGCLVRTFVDGVYGVNGTRNKISGNGGEGGPKAELVGTGETEEPMGGLEPPSGDEPRICYATSVDLQF